MAFFPSMLDVRLFGKSEGFLSWPNAMDKLEDTSNMLLLQTSLLNELSKLKLQKGGKARMPWLRIRWGDRIAGMTTRKLVEAVDLIRQATAGVVLDHKVI